MHIKAIQIPTPQRVRANSTRALRVVAFAARPRLRLQFIGDGSADHLPGGEATAPSDIILPSRSVSSLLARFVMETIVNASCRAPLGSCSPAAPPAPLTPAPPPPQVGRGPECPVCLPYGTVSLQQTLLEVQEGSVYVTDLKSTNGSTLGGRPLKANKRTRVQPGDELQLGDPYLAKFVLLAENDEPDTVTATAQAALSALSMVGAAVLPAASSVAVAAGGAAAAIAAAAASLAVKRPQPVAPTLAAASQPRTGGTLKRRVVLKKPQPVTPTMSRGGRSAKVVAAQPASQARALTPIEPDLPSFADERESAEAAVSAVEAGLGMPLQEWRARMADVASVARPAAGPAQTEQNTQAEMLLPPAEILPSLPAMQPSVGLPPSISPSISPLEALGGAFRGVGAAVAQVNITNNYNMYNLSVGRDDATAAAKAALLGAVLGADRGSNASAAARSRVEAAARALEAQNPSKRPLASPLLNGRWLLQWSSLQAPSDALGIRPAQVFQVIDIFKLILLTETVFAPLPFVRWTSVSVASLEARSDSRLALKWKGFRVGGIDLPPPPQTAARAALQWEQAALGQSGEAWVDITYLDFDLRLARTGSGDLLVLTRADGGSGNDDGRTAG